MNRLTVVVCTFFLTTFSFVIPNDVDVFAQQPVLENVGSACDEFSPIVFDDPLSDDPLPVVIWHGLGDSADSDGINSVASLIEELHPGTYVLPISLAEGGATDASQSWFGDVNSQVDSVCQQLSNDPILSTAPAIDAIGFSQGGQFLRGYVERCGHWAPRVRSLLTFGSQHNGIATFQKCGGWSDFLCKSANYLLESSLVWSDFIQTKVVPAQYYRPADDFENYVNSSNFLADINNERAEKNATYARNLAQLEKFVMIIFEDDQTVVPKESGWFAEVDLETKDVLPLQKRDIYTEDWIGLKELDQKNALVFETVPGRHMQLDEEDLVRLFTKYLGPAKSWVDKWMDEL